MKRILAAALLLTVLAPPVRAQELSMGSSMGAMFEAMMEAMYTFMDRMRDPWSGANRGWGGSPLGSSWPGSTPWSSWPGSSPWSSMPGTSPWTSMPGVSPWSSMPGSSPWSYGPGMSPWSPGGNPWSPGGNPWSPATGSSPWNYGPGGSPWNSGGNPWSGPAGGGPGWGGTPAQGSYMPKVNGAWLGTGGEALLLRGDRFRLSDGQGAEMSGTVRYLPNGFLELQPAWGGATRYEYGVLDDVLALRDSSGQVLMFQRAQGYGR